jgi:hypothetical protein
VDGWAAKKGMDRSLSDREKMDRFKQQEIDQWKGIVSDLSSVSGRF